MKILKITTFLSIPIFAILLVGCVGGGPLQPFPPFVKDKIELQTIYSPGLNAEVSAELGQTLISKRYIQSIPAIKIANVVSHTSSHNGINIANSIQPGTLTRIGEGERGTYYVSDSFSASINVLGKVKDLENSGGIVVPKNKELTRTVFRNPNKTDVAFLSENSQDIIIEKIDNKITPHKDSFIRELIYTGISKNVISIVYREYSNDLVRPAFSQELKYDLGEGFVIGYKGSRFEVIKATNTGITYKVLKQLD